MGATRLSEDQRSQRLREVPKILLHLRDKRTEVQLVNQELLNARERGEVNQTPGTKDRRSVIIQDPEPFDKWQ